MLLWKLLFWISCGIVLYNYIGYAVIVFLVNRFFGKKKSLAPDFYPSVSFIVAAYNEEDCIESKIKNCLSFDYPRNLVEFIFITDGSTDRTPEIVKNYHDVILLHQNQRQGKSAALNRAVQFAHNDILIFNDANTDVNKNAVKNLVRHYYNEKIGGVAGEKKVIRATGSEDEKTASEGLYWKYESFLKQNDSDFYSVVGAAGELFSVRRQLFEPVSPEVILDDFIISLKVAQKGFKILYEKNAVASELPSASVSEEKKRKVRISAGGFQAIVMLKSLFRFWEHPRLFFLYFSHRVLRWAASPFCLILILLSNIVIGISSKSFFWLSVLIMQLIFYSLAFLAHSISSISIKLKPVKFIYYFVFMNYSVLLGFVRFLKGHQSALWDKAKRAHIQGPVQ